VPVGFPDPALIRKEQMTTPANGAASPGADFTVTPTDVIAAANSARNTAANITEQLGALKSYVVSLEAEWKGIAAGTFSALMADYDIYAQMLNQALTGISDGLNGNYVNYSESEQQNINNLQAVNGVLPGANFA
jgi:WXG100 family type VII secretion target